MKIKTKFPQHNRNYVFARVAFLMLALGNLMMAFLTIEKYYYRSRVSLFLSTGGNMTLHSSGNLCHIPFDSCRCSLIANATDDTVKCISDVTAMIGHVIPLVSYVLQIYGISSLFSLTGRHSGLLTNVFWLFALLIFIIVVIIAHGSTCLQCYGTFALLTTGAILGIFLWHLIMRAHALTASRKNNGTHRQERILIARHNPKSEISTKINAP